MDSHQWIFLMGIVAILLLQNSSNVQGRHHSHSHKKHKSIDANAGFPAYAPSPGGPGSNNPDYPPISLDPSNLPYSDSPGNSISPVSPYPGNSNTGCIFNVMDFEAVGDGSTDDTTAFRGAWKLVKQNQVFSWLLKTMFS